MIDLLRKLCPRMRWRMFSRDDQARSALRYIMYSTKPLQQKHLLGYLKNHDWCGIHSQIFNVKSATVSEDISAKTIAEDSTALQAVILGNLVKKQCC